MNWLGPSFIATLVGKVSAMARRRPPPALALAARHEQTVNMGLGEAVRRLITVEFQYRNALGNLPQNLIAERDMLYEAMNRIPVEVGFDCNSDGVPDTVEIFQQAAATSCCRILPRDTSRSKPIDTAWQKAAQEVAEASFFESHGAAPPELPPELPPESPKPKKRGIRNLFSGK